jgi:hypothetical protein
MEILVQSAYKQERKRPHHMKTKLRILTTGAALALLTTVAFATFNYFQGFETNAGGWVVDQGITRVPSLGGALQLPASSGQYYAEIQNAHDAYGYPSFGEAGYSFYGGADSVNHGDFFQAIDVYINVNWALPAPYPSLEAFWIDMTPYHADPDNYGAEHNFRLLATGSSVDVKVDGQTTPIATLTSSGWYTFIMTWSKAALPTDPVITDMNVYDSNHVLLGTTQVLANSPGGPFNSADLRGNGYVWLTVWQNDFAGDLLGIDNVRTGLLPWLPLPASKDQCKSGGWQSLARGDNSRFKNQGDCIQYVNTGK